FVCVCVCIHVAPYNHYSRYVYGFIYYFYMCIYVCMYVCMYVLIMVYVYTPLPPTDLQPPPRAHPAPTRGLHAVAGT
ncbi:hypothetical protein B484DRAFT_328825, partial [Ochromonadaceae sp. CCMP2298]